MKHDFRLQSEGQEATEFVDWLTIETTESLKAAYGNIDALNSSLFLFANRAYESHLNEPAIYHVLATSIVEAGYSEQEEDPVLKCLRALFI